MKSNKDALSSSLFIITRGNCELGV